MTRSKTKTSSFGTSKREGHDASQFYSSNLYEGITINENQVILDRSKEIDPTFLHESHSFSFDLFEQIPDHSIHLLIVDLSALLTKKLFVPTLHPQLARLFQQILRLLSTGGKLALIVEDYDYLRIEKEFYPFHALLNLELLASQFIMRGEAIWHSGSPDIQDLTSNLPLMNLQPSYKHIMIYSKQVLKRNKAENMDTISRDQFLQYTKSIWKPQPELAPLLESVPIDDKPDVDCFHHILQLYSFATDTILCIYPEPNQSKLEKLRIIRKKLILCPIQSNFGK